MSQAELGGLPVDCGLLFACFPKTLQLAGGHQRSSRAPRTYPPLHSPFPPTHRQLWTCVQLSRVRGAGPCSRPPPPRVSGSCCKGFMLAVCSLQRATCAHSTTLGQAARE
jgi:hypothetical protein